MELTAKPHSLNNTFGKRKDRQSKTQLELVYEAFRAKPMTIMLEADKETGVMRSSICYYIEKLKAQNKVAIRKFRKCSITGYSNVQELTTNPDLFPQSNQLKLFR